jgi:hypothetical protein
MKFKHAAVGLVLSATVSASFATVLAFSNFTFDADGWLAKNGASPISWFSTGGDPGGYVQAKDQSGDATLRFFSAPAKFVGNKLAAYGGTLSFDLRVITVSPPNPYAMADVQLAATDGTLVSHDGNFSPVGSWGSFSLDLVADGSWWTYLLPSGEQGIATESTMKYVLENLIGLRINGDYRLQGEATALDSVLLTAGAIPGPASGVLLLAGLLATLAVARRRVLAR